MKYPLAILTAAAATIAAIIRSLLGDGELTFIDFDGPTPVPPITPRKVEQMAFAGGTNAEIADRFLLDESFIAKEYYDVLRSSRAIRNMTVRSLQFESARKLNGPMLIWLGRNELGQSLSPTKPGDDDPHIGPDDLP